MAAKTTAETAGAAVGALLVSLLWGPWVLMVAWGALASTQGWRTIGFGTAFVVNLLIGLFHTKPMPKALQR